MLSYSSESRHAITIKPFFTDSSLRPKHAFLDLEPGNNFYQREKKHFLSTLEKKLLIVAKI